MEDSQIEAAVVSPGYFKIEPQADRADSYIYKWYKNKGSNPVNTTDTIQITSNDIGSTYLCKISSYYNGSISEEVSSLEFTVA